MLAHPDYIPSGRQNYGLTMLIVAGTIITKPGGREPFLTATQPTLNEAGCHEYASAKKYLISSVEDLG